jgi:hypothetical protein
MRVLVEKIAASASGKLSMRDTLNSGPLQALVGSTAVN